jgi:phosphatidylglycerol lysyltransferase
MTRILAWGAVHKRPLSIIAALIVAALGFSALFGLLHSVRPHAIRQAFDALSNRQIAGALGLTAASYLLLTLYDSAALHVIGRRLPWRTAALASFTSYTLSHNLGLALLTGGSARYRIYRAAGLDGGAIGSVIALASLAFWNGVILLAGIAAATSTHGLPVFDRGLSLHWLHVAGLATIALCLVPLLLRRFGLRAVEIGGWRTPLPGAAMSASMTLVAALDLAAASAALYILLPAPEASALSALLPRLCTRDHRGPDQPCPRRARGFRGGGDRDRSRRQGAAARGAARLPRRLLSFPPVARGAAACLA